MSKEVKSAGKKVTAHSHARGVAASTLAQRPAGKPLKETDGIYSLVGIDVSKVSGGTSTKKHQFVK